MAMQAEKLMRQWVLGVQIHERVERGKAAERLTSEIHPYVAVSREAGAGGGEVSRLVAERLGWNCMDRELLDFMAEKYHLPHGALEIVDEQKRNWLHDLFGYWLEEVMVSQTEYVAHLGQMVLMAARHAKAVFVGRGARFYLPRERGLAIRLIAPRERRIQYMMQLRGFDRERAERYVAETDEGRSDFVKRYFGYDIADPSLYDLVINVQGFTLDEVAEIIVRECRRRFAGT